MSAPDFRLEDHGSLCILQPLSPAANEWAVRFIGHAMRWAGGFVIEPRYVQDIINGAESDGLDVEVPK